LRQVDQRANYRSVIDAMVRIAKSEGVFSLWKGSGPTVARAMALNLGMLSTWVGDSILFSMLIDNCDSFSEAKNRLESLTGTDTWTARL
jgi:hypothetical protein